VLPLLPVGLVSVGAGHGLNRFHAALTTAGTCPLPMALTLSM
jgi:hypothetical protein